MDRQDEIKRRLLTTFQAELEENRSILNRGLLTLEKGPLPEAQEAVLAELFRAAHSIKGASRAVELFDIEKTAHGMEDVLGAIRRKRIAPGPEVFDALFSASDRLKEIMAAHLKGAAPSDKKQHRIISGLSAALATASTAGQGGTVTGARNKDGDRPTAATPGSAPPQPPFRKAWPPSAKPSMPAAIQTEETIRVATAKLDRFMDRTGGLLVARMRTDQRFKELQDIGSLMVRWQKKWRRASAGVRRIRQSPENQEQIRPLLDFLEFNEKHMKSAMASMNRLIRRFAEDRNHLGHLSDALQDGVHRIRMRPIDVLFDPFPKMVRDMARRQEKTVDLKLEGSETEIDRKVLEAIKDPLIHLLRNAVDHGIETAGHRRKAGKPSRGSICLGASRKGGAIVLKVSDDGRGIDMAALKRQAEENKLMAPEAVAALSDEETMSLVFCSGLSTMAEASDISGRGVGLDVVRENIKRLHGSVEVDSFPGKGTTFILTLPLTLATSHILLVNVHGTLVAVPSASVKRILKISPNRIGSIDGRPAIEDGGQVLPLVSMGRALALAPRQKPAGSGPGFPVVVLATAGKRIAFGVDEVIDTRDVVVKPVGSPLKRVRNMAGGAILGSGEVVVVLNVADLMKAAEDNPEATAAVPARTTEPAVRRLLVVDDSTTTRTLEEKILAGAGYEVFVAANGKEAWSLLQSQALEAIVTDIDMPRMNGIDLTKKIRRNGRLKKLPVILVTSLESPRDKIRGMEAGADAYITKGAFDQNELLETVERLIG